MYLILEKTLNSIRLVLFMIYQGHPKSILGKYLFGRRFEI